MSPQRKTLETFGKKGRRNYVRIVRELVDNLPKIRVLWKEPHRQVESFDDTRNGMREAKAFAETKHDALTAPVMSKLEPLSLREVFEKYITAKVDEWSDNTLRLRRWRWSKLELYSGRNTLAHTVTREDLDGLKRALLLNHAPNQVRQAIKEITGVFRWAVDRDLIAPTKVTNYTTGFKKALLRTGPKMAEYSREERERIVAALDPRNPTQWRAWALNVLFAYCGPRQTAARHLELGDVELSQSSGRIHWREATAKNNEDWWQPMPQPVVEAFWVALGWRVFDQYDGRFLFYGAQRRTRGQALRRNTRRSRAKESIDGITFVEKPYTYGALIEQLHQAEVRAGIEHVKYRGAHGHRRGVGGDVHAATGSEKKAADWLGDRSLKVVRDHYLLTREEELRGTATLMESRTAPESQSSERHEMQSATTEGGADGLEGSESNLNREPAVGIEPTTARSQDDG